MANPVGRPREHDRDQIAKDIIEWARKEDSLNINKFCAHYEPIIPPSMLGIWARESEQFRRSYESAKAFIAYRREEKLNTNELHVKAYDLNATNYDVLLREENTRLKEFEASLKAKEDKKASEIEIGHLEAVLDVVKAAQASYSESARNIEDKRRRKESMS